MSFDLVITILIGFAVSIAFIILIADAAKDDEDERENK